MSKTADPQSTAQTARLARLARFAVVASFATALVIIGWMVALWLKPGLLEAKVIELSSAPPLLPLTADRLVIGGVVSMLAPIVMVLALVEIGRLFALFATGEVFDVRVPLRLRRLGRIAILLAIVSCLTRTVMTLVVTSVNPPGSRQISFGIDSGELLALVAGFLFFALSLVMAEALRLARENESFV